MTYRHTKRRALFGLVFVASSSFVCIAQDTSTASLATPSSGDSASTAEPVVFTTQQDHQNMLQQLGVIKLRPGRSSDEKNPNVANYDEAKANPYPKLPELLTTANGETIATPDEWWKKRRPEIVELLEREVYGRVPANAPKVQWEVRETREIEAGGKAAVQQHIVGVVNNDTCPEIKVNISMSLTLPKETDGPVPVLLSFGWTPFEPNPFSFGGRGPGRGAPNGPRPPSREDKLIKAGWGCATINPSTIQDDAGGFQRNPFGGGNNANTEPKGAGLTRGVIGLVNHGQPRKPDDWGALRAWGWGASRALDYFETEPKIDAKKVGIAGVSRYGKAALVAMAFDERFGMGLIASSGAGGTKLFRRNFGESLENLAGSGAYHWMTGNYIRYSAAEASFGNRTANDLPVDSHMTLALCAPRLTFISHGIPERGDAHWLDHQGSFMSAIASQPIFRMLGAKDLGRTDDYTTERMPGVNVDLLDGQLAWRQHDGGHTDEPNIEHFIRWANRMFGRPAVDLTFAPSVPSGGAPNSGASIVASVVPMKRNDPNSMLAHEQLVAKSKQGKIDVYFVGDSITRRWGATDYPAFLAHWNECFHGWNAANFGWGGDTTHNILWRLKNGEFENLTPKIVVLQAGTNNLPWSGSTDTKTIQEIIDSMRAIVEHIQNKSPGTIIVLTGVFPRSQNADLKTAIEQINQELSKMSNGKTVRYVNINLQLGDKEGRLLPGISTDGLHLERKGYEVWADALKPILTELLGPPATVDHAPPPTGDPKAATKE